jgi:GT2 family glycosyltransferase
MRRSTNVSDVVFAVENSVAHNFAGGIDLITPHHIKGWAANLTRPDLTLVVQIFNGAVMLGELHADKRRPDLEPWYGANCNHGFEQAIAIPPGVDPSMLRFVAKDFDAEIRLPPDWTPTVIQIDSISKQDILGWAWNPFDCHAHLRLSVCEWDREIGIIIANKFREDLFKSGFGGGDHAFHFHFPKGLEVDLAAVTVDLIGLKEPSCALPASEFPSQGAEESANGLDPGQLGSDGMIEALLAEPPKALSPMEVAESVFDAAWYLQQAKGDDAGDKTPFEHWRDVGRHKGLSPHPLFDPQFYRSELSDAKLGDVEAADLFLRFLTQSAEENADPHPCFSMQWYRERYFDEGEARHPWTDYLTHTGPGRREPNWLFSSVRADALGDGVPANGGTSLARYLQNFGRTAESPHALLDFALMLRHNKDISKDNIYVSFWLLYRKREIRTHIYFDPKYYRSQQTGQSADTRAWMDYALRGEKNGIHPISLFDPLWHAAQYGRSDKFDTILEEFVAVGERLHRHPCPGFDPRYYLESNNDVARAGVAPLRHFIASGQREKRRIHRRFALGWYASTLPEVHNDQALEYWLHKGRFQGDAPHPGVIVERRGNPEIPLKHYLRPKFTRNERTPGLRTALTYEPKGEPAGLTPDVRGEAWLIEHFERARDEMSAIAVERLKLDEPIARQFENFDARAEAEYIQKTNEAFAEGHYPRPLVSVIVPTRNRVATLSRALNSILNQTWSNLEVVIVDDGSTDGTEKLIERHFDDKRIVYAPIMASGVSAARNFGLRSATGEYVAYLDSDNYWEPQHVELTLKTMLLQEARAGYSVLRAFNTKGSVRFRGARFDMPSLQRENYIDMNVYMHHRGLIDSGLRFDETMKRCVDWDFILRASVTAPPVHAPIVGCNYVDDNDTLDRITSNELSGDFYRICQRDIDLAPHTTGQAPAGECRATIVWPLSDGDWAQTEKALWSAVDHIANGPDELIIVNNNCAGATTAFLASISRMTAKVRVIHLWRSFHHFPAVNLASKLAKARRLLLWDSAVAFDGAAIDDLLSVAEKVEVPILIPLVTDNQGDVVGELATARSTSQLLHPFLTGRRAPETSGVANGIVAVRSPVVIDARTFDALGGFAASYAITFGLADFCLRALSKFAGATMLKFDARFRATRPLSPIPGEGEFLKELDSLKKAWIGQERVPVRLPDGFELALPRAQRLVNRNWTLCSVMDDGAQIRAPRVAKAKQFVIRCPAPNTPAKLSWGDYHYALSMIDALESFGHRGTIECREDWGQNTGSGDIFFHIHGIAETKPVAGAFNAMWVISHPDKLKNDKLNAMDAVFVAGPAHKRQLAQNNNIDACLLLQGVDGSRFGGEIEMVNEVVGKALFVGNSRMQIRPIVLDAQEAGLPLVVYGNDWANILPKDLVRAAYIPNETLANWYGSASVVLNDHWASMRHYGIISNRIFDVVATGTSVITDFVEGLEPIFGESVRAYHDPEELPGLFAELGDRRFIDNARYIRAHHSISNRVEEILQHLGIAKR